MSIAHSAVADAALAAQAADKTKTMPPQPRLATARTDDVAQPEAR